MTGSFLRLTSLKPPRIRSPLQHRELWCDALELNDKVLAPAHGYTFDDATPAADSPRTPVDTDTLRGCPTRFQNVVFTARLDGWNERRRWSAGNKFGLKSHFRPSLRSHAIG